MNEQYLSVFIDESKEYIQTLNDSLLRLEKDYHDSEAINETFRALHTLKGMSGTMGFETMSKLCHKMEQLLDKIRSKKITLDSDLLDKLFAGVDVLDKMISEIVKNGTDKVPNVDVQSMMESYEVESNIQTEKKSEKTAEKTNKAITVTDSIKKVISEAEKEGYRAYHLAITLSEGTQFKAVRMYMVFKAIEDHGGQILNSEPSVEDIEQEKFDLDVELIVIIKEDKENLRNILMSISEIEKVTIRDILADYAEETEEVRKIDEKTQEEKTEQSKEKRDLFKRSELT